MIYRILEFMAKIGDSLFIPYNIYEKNCTKNELCPYCRKPLERKDHLSEKSIWLHCDKCDYRTIYEIKSYLNRNNRDYDDD